MKHLFINNNLKNLAKEAIFEYKYFSLQYYCAQDLLIIMKKEIIEILSDSQEREVFKSKQMMILQKQIQDEASMLKTNTGLLLAVNKQFIDGTPNQKEKVLLERIQKMFIDKFLFNLSTDHFCLKREPNYNKQNCQLILNQLIVFGTDFWPTRKIKSDALAVNISLQPFKIDESHTKLKFLNYDDAKRWLQFYAKDNNKVKQKIEEDVEVMQQEKKQQNKLRGWFSLQSYFYQQFQRTLQARFCTNYESDIKQLIQDVKTSSYVKFKQQVQEQMLKQQLAKAAYEQAQQRKRRQRKFKKNQQFNSFYKNTRQHKRKTYQVLDGERQRRQDKSRNKSRDYYYQRSRDKRNYKDYSHNYDYKKYKAQNSPNNFPNQTIGGTQMKSFVQNNKQTGNNTNILAQIHDESCNYSFLLESNNDNNEVDKMVDISIAQAMGQMKIEDNEYADLSVEIRPKDVIQNSQNMSITLIQPEKILQPIDMSIQSYLNKSKEKDKNSKQKQEKIKKVEQEKQRMKKQKLKESTKSKKDQHSKISRFDYMQYINETQKEQIKAHHQSKPQDQK